MKENIEEDLKVLEELAKNEYGELLNCWDFGERSVKAINNILSDYKRVLKENEELKHKYDKALSDLVNAEKENEKLKEYIMLAPNLDEMTAIKYRNIQKEAYIRGRAEEQKKAEQIIYENYIPVQKVKDEIEYINKFEEDLYKKENIIQVLQDLLEEKGE